MAAAGTAVHGKNGAIYINGVKLVNKSEWSLNMTREYADVTTFRDRNKVSAAGLMDISGTFSGLLAIGPNTPGDAVIIRNDGTPYTVAVYPVDGGDPVGSGPAFVDCSVTASSTDAVRITGNFKAAGDWTVTAPS